jgi:uncharacterized protein (DUF58 family)
MLFHGETLKRLQRLALLAGRAGPSRLLAPRPGERTWEGTEVSGLRDYAPGDDYRHVDWMLCARRDEVLTKTFQGPADARIHFLLDCSARMGLGRPAKFDVARQIAAGLGYVALASGCQVGLTAFSGRALAGLPPLRGTQSALRLVRFLEALALDSSPTGQALPAAALAACCRRPGPLVLVSDLLAPAGFQSWLDLLCHRGYQPRIVQVYDPMEAEPTALGDVELYDVQTQAAQRVTLTPRVLRRYRALFAGFLAAVRQYCARRGLECVQLASDQDPELLFANLLRPRGAGPGGPGRIGRHR